MQITCFNDQNTWKVGAIEVGAAKLRFALGFPEETFYCPKCRKGNKVSKAEFQAAMAAPAQAPKPVGPAAPKPAAYVPSDAMITGHVAQPAVAGAGPSIAKPRHGHVLVRSLRVRSDHSKQDPVVAGLVKDQKVEVLSTWTDGKDTWAQLGPNQWSAVIYDGQAMIDIDDN
jgi:hypothetical protein